MLYHLAADLVIIIHAGFILFVLLGGSLTERWPRVAYAQIASVIWGALVEFAGWICPLTPLENYLRMKSGGSPYPGSFTEHYIVPIIYPGALTRRDQILIGIGVLVVNLVVYGYGWTAHQKRCA